jgi:predicted acetyltransferase
MQCDQAAPWVPLAIQRVSRRYRVNCQEIVVQFALLASLASTPVIIKRAVAKIFRSRQNKRTEPILLQRIFCMGKRHPNSSGLTNWSPTIDMAQAYHKHNLRDIKLYESKER